MSQFTATPSVLNIESRVESEFIVELDYNPVNTYYYPNRHVELPPNVTITFPGGVRKPIPMTVSYDPKRSGAVPFGQYDIRIEMVPAIVNLPPCYINLTLRFNDDQKEEEQTTSSSLPECTLCYCNYDDSMHTPKILGCGHTFCLECIREIERRHNNPTVIWERTDYVCPIDRIGILQTPSMLPKNRFVLDLLDQSINEERRKRLSGPRLVKDPDVPCYEDERHESSVYCENCKETFCSSCYMSVHSSKMLSKHESIPVADRPLVLPMCPLHEDQQAQYICHIQNCSVGHHIFCATCLQRDHKDHPYKILEHQVADNIGYLEGAVNQLKSAESTVGKQIREADQCVSTYELNGEDMQQVCADINQYFEEKRQRAHQKLEDWVNEKRIDLVIKKSECEAKLNNIQRIRKKAERTLKRKTDLHADMTRTEEFQIMEKEIADVEKTVHFFPLKEYRISPAMMVRPTSPIVINSRSPSPEPEEIDEDVPAEPPRKVMKREKPMVDQIYEMLRDLEEPDVVIVE